MASKVKGRQVETNTIDVTIASGAASPSISFREPFTTAPEVHVFGHAGDGATITPGTPTTTGCPITISGSGLPDGVHPFLYTAAERF